MTMHKSNSNEESEATQDLAKRAPHQAQTAYPTRMEKAE